MASLDAVGKLKDIKTFNHNIDYEKLSKIELENESEYKMAVDTREFALKNNKDTLARNLDKQIKNYETKRIITYINSNYTAFINNPHSKSINYKIFNYIINNDTKKSFKSILKVIKKKVLKK